MATKSFKWSQGSVFFCRSDSRTALSSGPRGCALGRPGGTRTVAPPLEIVGDGIFGYQDKYGGHADLRVPAALGEDDRTALATAAVTMFAFSVNSV